MHRERAEAHSYSFSQYQIQKIIYLAEPELSESLELSESSGSAR